MNVQLESKQKLPQKVTDVICDISMVLNNAIGTSNSNDLMSSSFKAIVGSEAVIESSSKMLNTMNTILKEMDNKFVREGPFDMGVMKLSDAQESLQRLERCIYREDKAFLSEEDEEWGRRAREGWNESIALCHDDSDFCQMLKDREMLPESDELLMRNFDAQNDEKKKADNAKNSK